MEGLEPSQQKLPEPKPGAYTNFATSALILLYLDKYKK